jgi:hypothetical protein
VQAGDFHRERVVARGHARAALQHHPVRRRRAEQGADRVGQFVRGLEAVVRVQITPSLGQPFLIKGITGSNLLLQGDSEFGRGGCSPVQILLTQGAVQAD